MHHHPVTLAVIEQECERRARAMAEDLHGARQRVLPESLSTHSTEPIHAFPEIHGLGRHKHAALGGALQQERTATKARTHAARGNVDSGAWMHRRVPSGRCSSIWVAAGFWGREGGSGTFTKSEGGGRQRRGRRMPGGDLLFEVRQAQP